MAVDFLSETVQVRRHWRDIFKVLKEKYCQLEFFIQQKISSKITGWKNSSPRDPYYKEAFQTERKYYQIKICIYTRERRAAEMVTICGIYDFFII